MNKSHSAYISGSKDSTEAPSFPFMSRPEKEKRKEKPGVTKGCYTTVTFKQNASTYSMEKTPQRGLLCTAVVVKQQPKHASRLIM